jgi:hypothetical protein
MVGRAHPAGVRGNLPMGNLSEEGLVGGRGVGEEAVGVDVGGAVDAGGDGVGVELVGGEGH